MAYAIGRNPAGRPLCRDLRHRERADRRDPECHHHAVSTRRPAASSTISTCCGRSVPTAAYGHFFGRTSAEGVENASPGARTDRVEELRRRSQADPLGSGPSPSERARVAFDAADDDGRDHPGCPGTRSRCWLPRGGGHRSATTGSPFEYAVPEASSDAAQPGVRVRCACRARTCRAMSSRGGLRRSTPAGWHRSAVVSRGAGARPDILRLSRSSPGRMPPPLATCSARHPRLRARPRRACPTDGGARRGRTTSRRLCVVGLPGRSGPAGG